MNIAVYSRFALFLLLPAAAYPHPARTMAQTANAFLASLTPEQRMKATFEFNDEQRLDWHFVPRERKGLPLREMTVTQRHLAHALLSAALSSRGFVKTATIMSLEDILRELERDSGERRNPEKYYFTIFGQPKETGVWGFRFEGHHISQNFTVAGGKIAASPNFFGANPAEVRQGPRKGLRALAPEEDLAREFLQSLTPEQKKVAIISPTAYKDILTGNSRKAALTGQPSGLPASKLTAAQRELLRRVVAEYAENLPEPVAAERMAKFQRAGGNLYFAWAGVEQRGGPHYYRIQSAEFLIEYDNTQNDANHIHSVWRDFNGDWGADLLKEHYQSGHKH